MRQTEIQQVHAGEGVRRRQYLAVGATLLTGCVGVFDGVTPTGGDDAVGTDQYAFGDGHDDEYAEGDVAGGTDMSDEPDEDGSTAAHEFAGFTHFPVDFAAFFSDLDDVNFGADQPIVPFFSDQKVLGAGKWYLVNPHDDAPIDHEWGMRRSEWKTYLAADSVVTIDDFNEEPSDEVNGETVYLDFEFEAAPIPDVRILYEKFRVRETIVDEVMAAGGEVFLPAGTHIGYGLNAFWVQDWRMDEDGVNPFDYFSDAKQKELLALYQPVYRIYRDEGIHPFTDLTESRFSWDVHGTLQGGWIRDADVRAVFDNGSSREWYEEEMDWSLLGLFPVEVLNDETYWRVIEHPWNRKNGYVGRFAESEIGITPDAPLYADDPLGKSRFYLLEGDLSGGVAMIIKEWEWSPLDPEREDNHPSVGDRRYLRFEVSPGKDVLRDVLTIEGFVSDEEARVGFTDEVVKYIRYRFRG